MRRGFAGRRNSLLVASAAIVVAAPWCSAMTASSVSLAAVTPMRSKHSATMLLDAVSRLMSRSIGVILRRSMIDGPVVGFAQQANDVVGQEFAVEDQDGFVLALFLVEQFLELAEQLGQVGLEAFAPVADAGVGHGQQAHEDVRAADAVPARFAGQPQRLVQGLDGRVGQQFQAETAAREKNVVHGFVRRRHGTRPFTNRQGSLPLIMAHPFAQRKNRRIGAVALRAGGRSCSVSGVCGSASDTWDSG